MKIVFLLAAACASAAMYQGTPLQTIILTANGSTRIAQDDSLAAGENLVGRIAVNDVMDSVGWIGLYIESVASQASASQSYRAAGYAEGALTAPRIAQYYQNTIGWASATASTRDRQWISQHMQYMRNMSVANPTSNFWSYVGLILDQIEGLAQGYTDNWQVGMPPINNTEMFFINFISEIGDVQEALREVDAPTTQSHKPRHCSAFIKPTTTDLFVAHDTWGSFEGMLRMFKIYNFSSLGANLTFTPAAVSMSGYPATLSSMDDWYQTSNGLAVQETTNDVWNTTIYHEFIHPTSVSEFIRVMAANTIAVSAQQWTRLFCTENSGTYNNQYMAVDFKMYTPSDPIVILPGTLWIAEQLPGYCPTADVSDVLRSQGYWASYNIPYFPEIFEYSGYAAREERFGTFFSYTKYARPEIFRRFNSTIADIDDMKKLMRYNNYTLEPMSVIPNCNGTIDNRCDPSRSAMLTIASRGDLDPPGNASTYGPLVGFVGQRDHAAIDSKIAVWSTWGKLSGWIVNGPPYDDVPAFRYSASPYAGVSHVGVPDLVKFPWIRTEQAFAPAPDSDLAKRVAVVTAIVGSVSVLVVAFVVGRICRRDRQRKAAFQENQHLLGPN